MQPTEVLTVAGAPNKKWNASWFVVMNFLFSIGGFFGNMPLQSCIGCGIRYRYGLIPDYLNE